MTKPRILIEKNPLEMFDVFYRAVERAIGDKAVIDFIPFQSMRDKIDWSEYDLYLSFHKKNSQFGQKEKIYKCSYLKDSFVLGDEPLPYHSSPTPKGRISETISKKFCENLSELMSEGTLSSKYDQTNSSTLFPYDALYPLQTPRDITLLRYKYDWHEHVRHVSDFAKRHKIKIAYKLHPHVHKYTAAHYDTLNKYTHDFFCKIDVDIRLLLRLDKPIILINSGVGFEGLIYGRSVFRSGNCDFKNVATYYNPENMPGGLLDERIDVQKGYSHVTDYLTSDQIFWISRHNSLDDAEEKLAKTLNGYIYE